jgi:hypothetical protein
LDASNHWSTTLHPRIPLRSSSYCSNMRRSLLAAMSPSPFWGRLRDESPPVGETESCWLAHATHQPFLEALNQHTTLRCSAKYRRIDDTIHSLALFPPVTGAPAVPPVPGVD